MATNFVKLYKNHDGAIGYWSAWADEGGKVYIQYAKTLDGTPVRKIYQAEGKNIGRANETTPLEQAISEINSKARLKKDKGYVDTLELAQVPSTNGLGLLKPMLATPFEKVKPEKIDWDNAYVQPKLDGHRALYKDGVLYSRQGKVLDIPHITEAIRSEGLDHLHLDGELYLHGKSLQEVSKLIKKHRPESLDLQYHVYDQILDEPFIERITGLALNFAERKHPNLVPVPTVQIRTQDALTEYHAHYRSLGYEGTMLRFGKDAYQDGKRSRTLLKLKEFQDAEFEIVGVTEGKPYITDKGTYQVPVYECQTPEGKTFTVTAPGTMHEKHALWEDREASIGKHLTVKFHYLSKDGIPQLPVALRFHETV